jgi:predicted short-subunit dehydrogenase-like oxidoreductase (DUF2520 family)
MHGEPMHLLKSITMIGGGRLATNLGRLWAAHGTIRIQDVLCRSQNDSRRAVGLMGAGRPVTKFEALHRADVYLIATPDGAIETSTERLVAAGCVDESCVVVHCSGAESSELLKSARQAGAAAASAHPLMTFTTQPMPMENFTGTYCAIEGDARACSCIGTLFSELGANIINLSTGQKLLYHAAATFASNYLITMMQMAIEIHESLAIQPEVSREMLAPLARRSLENAIALGPRAAMTGPIARGDAELVERQFTALEAANPRVATLYRALAASTARVVDMPNPFSRVDPGTTRG